MILYSILFFIIGVLVAFIIARNIFHKPGAIPPDIHQQKVNEIMILQQQITGEKERSSQLQSRITELDARKLDLVATTSKLEAERDALLKDMESRDAELRELHKKFQEEFESIANKIILNNSQRIQQQHSEKLTDILSPLKDKISGFEKRVQEVNEQNIRDNQSLKEQLKALQELNRSIGEEARNLTTALKGQVKTQGNWGEMILETILERSGLVKDREYFVQESFTDEHGKRLQPDVLIRLPESKTIIIDSKVSLVAYEQLANCNDEAEYQQHLKEHLSSLKKHIKGLGEKKYQQIYDVRSLDFVLMFVPVEPAFNVAVAGDPALFTDAFDHNIVLVGPSTLLATLRTIASIWKLEYQNQYARDIAKLSGSLYDKFVGFLDDMARIDKNLKASHDSWDNAMKKLSTGRGNIIRITEKMKKLGADASKSIPENIVRDAVESDE
jgi:DNA recombination protein RmuC